jgi:hypothetical protein
LRGFSQLLHVASAAVLGHHVVRGERRGEWCLVAFDPATSTPPATSGGLEATGGELTQWIQVSLLLAL